jgi:hypothetical protein
MMSRLLTSDDAIRSGSRCQNSTAYQSREPKSDDVDPDLASRLDEYTFYI